MTGNRCGCEAVEAALKIRTMAHICCINSPRSLCSARTVRGRGRRAAARGVEETSRWPAKGSAGVWQEMIDFGTAGGSDPYPRLFSCASPY